MTENKMNQLLIGKTIASIVKKDKRWCPYDEQEYEALQQGLTITFTDGTKVTFQSETQYSDQEAWVELQEEK